MVRSERGAERVWCGASEAWEMQESEARERARLRPRTVGACGTTRRGTRGGEGPYRLLHRLGEAVRLFRRQVHLLLVALHRLREQAVELVVGEHAGVDRVSRHVAFGLCGHTGSGAAGGKGTGSRRAMGVRAAVVRDSGDRGVWV